MRLPCLIIRASAGSGKTFQLAMRMIGVLARGELPDHVLATTFTRKAAGEILERVLLRMADAALSAEEAANLSKLTATPKASRQEWADRLAELVRRIHRVRVSTLDSFAMQLAGGFSPELALPAGWRIASELEAVGMRQEAIGRVIRQHPAEVATLVGLLVKGEARRSVLDELDGLAAGLEGVFLQTDTAAWDRIPAGATLSGKELDRLLERASEEPLDEGSQLEKARNGDLENFRSEEWIDFLKKGLAKAILETEPPKYNRKPIPHSLVEVYRRLISHTKGIVLERLADQTRATRRFLELYHEEHERIKLRRRLFRFEDVTRKAAHEDVTGRFDEVAFRMDFRVDHLLLDEFQDTSLDQWRLLLPFARRTVEKVKSRSFFCVGDGKQAIYGWRGGVAELFDAVDRQLEGLTTMPLSKSYRSSPVVMKVVNQVFSGVASLKVLAEHRIGVEPWARQFQEHTTHKSDLAGYVRLCSAPEAKRPRQGAVTLQYAADEVARIAARSPGRTVGVLVRDNKAVGTLIYWLRKQGVWASEEGGNPLTDSPIVAAVLSAFTAADQPADRVARYHVATSPLGGVLDLTDHDPFSKWLLFSHDLRDRLLGEGYGRLLSDWMDRLASSCDARELSRLSSLVELAWRYDPQCTLHPRDFVAFVESERVQDPTAAPVRVMTIHQAKGLEFDIVVLPQLDGRWSGLTPQLVVGRPDPAGPPEVVLRYANAEERKMLPGRLQEVFDEHKGRQTREALCLLYVSVTRAIHELVMIVAPRKPGSTPSLTFAGIVRESLKCSDEENAESILFETGDPRWFTTVDREAAPAAAPLQDPAPLVLADQPAQRSRSLVHRRPSDLAGGGKARLSDLMRLERSEALDWGTLFHAWFETIEWIDDGEPSDDVLIQAARERLTSPLPLDSAIAEFRAMLRQTEIRNVLCKTSLEAASKSRRDTPAAATQKSQAPTWAVMRERRFAVVHDGHFLIGSIDRLVVLYDGGTPAGAEILDYKTDPIARGDVRAVDQAVRKYKPQLDLYCVAAAQQLGLSRKMVSASLILLKPGIVARA
jgi:ATP-dependent exoDNAse (exonuclease V) beta subunit